MPAHNLGRLASLIAVALLAGCQSQEEFVCGNHATYFVGRGIFSIDPVTEMYSAVLLPGKTDAGTIMITKSGKRSFLLEVSAQPHAGLTDVVPRNGETWDAFLRRANLSRRPVNAHPDHRRIDLVRCIEPGR